MKGTCSVRPSATSVVEQLCTPIRLLLQTCVERIFFKSFVESITTHFLPFSILFILSDSPLPPTPYPPVTFPSPDLPPPGSASHDRAGPERAADDAVPGREPAAADRGRAALLPRLCHHRRLQGGHLRLAAGQPLPRLGMWVIHVYPLNVLYLLVILRIAVSTRAEYGYRRFGSNVAAETSNSLVLSCLQSFPVLQSALFPPPVV